MLQSWVDFADFIVNMDFSKILLNDKILTGFLGVAIPSVCHNMQKTHCSCICRQNKSYCLSLDCQTTMIRISIIQLYTFCNKRYISSTHFLIHYIIVNKRIYPLILGICRQRLALLLWSEIPRKQKKIRTRTGFVSV
jgi:hypothetical protein